MTFLRAPAVGYFMRINLLIIKKPYAIISNECHTIADFCIRAHKMGFAET